MGQIEMCVDSEEWIIRINPEGIFFNREKYPNATPDEFAQAFTEILEHKYTVHFERKKPPYERDRKKFDWGFFKKSGWGFLAGDKS